MSEGAISGDREQQKRDNNASRRQSGLEPRPQDRIEPREGASKPRRGNGVGSTPSRTDETRQPDQG